MEDTRNIYLAYALYDSIEDKSVSHIRQLLENEKANPNTLLPEKDFTPLHYVVGCDSLLFAEEVTKLFLQHGGDPNIRNSDGLTPVHVAAAWGHADLLRLLLLNGGDPWLQDNESCTAFHYAVQEAHWNVAEVLHQFHLKDISLQQANNSSIEKPKYEVNLEKVILSNGDILLECGVSSTVPESQSTLKDSVSLFSGHYSDLYVGNNLVDNLKQSSNEKSKKHIQMPKSGVHSSGCSNLLFSDSSISTKDASRVIECITLSSSETSDKNNYSSECKVISSDQNSDMSSICSEASIQKSATEKCVSFEYKQSSSVFSTKSFTSGNSAKSRRKLLPHFGRNLGSNSTHCDFNSSCMTVDQQENSTNEAVKHITENMLHSVTCSLEKLSVDSSCDGIETLDSSHSLSRRNLGLRMCSRSELSHSELNNGFLDKDTHNGMNCTPGKYDEGSIVCWMFQSTPKKKHLSYERDASYEGQLKANKNQKPELAATTNAGSDLIAGAVLEKSVQSLQKILSEDTSPKSDLHICLEGTSDSGRSTKTSDYVNFRTCSSDSSSNSGSYFSITEEYRYTDEENGIVLKERRILTEKCSIPDNVFESVKIPAECCVNLSLPDSLSSSSTLSSLKLNLDYDTESLRAELKERNCIPGPITKTTKRLYLKKLVKLKKTGEFCNPGQRNIEYSPELECTLKTMEWVNGLAAYIKLEQEVATQFSNPSCERRWRGGITKSAFCYLLLDPRVTKNLPCRTQTMQPLQIWQTFLSSVFYIGKGVRNRPYSHLYQAASLWKTKSKSSDKKVQYILDIWSEGFGVVCLHVFQNVIPVEAHTREAAMIEAMGLKALKNVRHSEYYGTAATWNSKQRRKLGVYLLYRALLVFLSEGERQLGPENL
ncbi:uncharacterized protein LOC126263415 [Schistocerca nitens]|uniref:uncharacterized protein LOC126263415 n=1 Tax=Schistocerca nitens TaxID=7011 RepID=UPI002118C3BE|nr:uncharacterized protein LOC126263415 [Schistocerca nitens]